MAALVLGTHPRLVAATVLDVRVASGNDDAEESATGVLNLDSTDLEIVDHAGPQTVGMRWAGLGILHGATITNAWMQFTCKEAESDPTRLEIQAEDTDDAAPFTGATADITTRPRTSMDVDWTPGPWLVGEAGGNERTPDLAGIIQAIVNRPGWAPGNALVIIVRGTGLRTAWSWDGNAAAAVLLHVEFSGGDEPPPPSTWPIALYAGYNDTHHPDNPLPKPDPWQGSPGVVFVGTADTPEGGWDSSCLMLDNISPFDITNVVVSVDIGENHFALWGVRTIPARTKLILAQTGFENFDGSDTNEAGCPTCDPSWCVTRVSSTIPRITVRTGSTTTVYFDHDQVLNTRGVDIAGCPYTGGRSDESHEWVLLPPEGMTLGAPLPDSPSRPAPTEVALAVPAPNPARGSVTFRFSMPASGPVRLGLYDVAGRLVRMSLDAELDAGEYQHGMTLADVKPGIYFGVLRARGGEARRSIVVAR